MITPQQEEQTIMEQAKAAIAAQQAQASQMNTQTYAQSQIMEEQENNLAEQQLNLEEELETIEHLLRGHIQKRDSNGILSWDEEVGEDLELLNEAGVREVMQVVRFYLSKRKLLANYSEEEVNWKMEDFGIRLADVIFMKYRELGLDTEDKKKRYEEIVFCIVDAVHDVYSRALGGKERDSIRKHWNISETMGGMGDIQKKPNPLSWLRR